MITPTVQQLEETQRAIETHLAKVRSHPDQRAGAHPYYRFHPPGTPVHGTVMMFHGFSMRPHQVWRLAEYLFQNGFNVYQLTLAGHDRINPAKNWPQIDLRPEYVGPLMEAVLQDPVLQAAISQDTADGEVAIGQQHALLQRLFEVAPQMQKFSDAIAQPRQPDFDRYFISSHEAFLSDALQRLEELSAMPGPIHAVGLSVGGATALGLAAEVGNRIEKVVAYAPLLKIIGEDRRQFVQLTGPLDINETGWDPDLQFPVGALTAADYFGSEVRSPDTVSKLKSKPIFIALTENEDAADIASGEQLFADLGGPSEQLGQERWLYKYPSSAMVPHAMVDPTEVSQGMRNLFWQSLYQETLRFLTIGKVEERNLATLSQDSALPVVEAIG